MSERVVGLDIGGTITRLVEARMHKGAFEIRKTAKVRSASLPAALREAGLKGCRAIVGVTGRDMILRMTQVPPVPQWQLKELMRFEIEDVAEQSGDALSADFNLLTGAAIHTDDEMVLLALVRDSLILERSSELAGAGVKVGAFTPNAIALHNAVVATDGGEGTVMAASLAGRNTDIALIQDGELLYARNLGGGGDLFTDAIKDAFRIDPKKAELAKRKLGRFAAPGETLTGQKGAVARALVGPLRQVTGMLQSTVVLCRNQLKAADLQLDRVLLCGAGAGIPGLDQALTRSLGVPVQEFDPTDGYLTGAADIDGGRGADYAVATGLALMALLKDAYKVEILTEAEKKKREFSTKTVWLVLAAALVVVHLALAGWATKGNHDAASADVTTMRREVSRRKTALRNYERAVAEGREAAAKLTRLEDLTALGSGTLAVLDLLDAYLPPELWVESVRTQRAMEPGFDHGSERRPFVVVEGSGKEQSRSLTDAVTEVTLRLRADPAVAGVVQQFSTDNRGKFNFSLSIDTSVFPSEPADQDAAADDDEAEAG
ncbi:MAG: pilus assembly protein PilM [Planctomycetota bacterium]